MKPRTTPGRRAATRNPLTCKEVRVARRHAFSGVPLVMTQAPAPAPLKPTLYSVALTGVTCAFPSAPS